MTRYDDIDEARQIAFAMRDIMQKAYEHHPSYNTDRDIYGALHSQVLKLLEWDMRMARLRRQAFDAEPVPHEGQSRDDDWSATDASGRDHP